jgi:DNA-binding NarL/FixJ family response regulator
VLDGIAAAHQLHGDAPDVRVLIHTTFDDDDMVDAALRAGSLASY